MTRYMVTAPSDSRLAGGGGYPIRIYVPTAAAAAEAAQNYITFQTDFGPEQTNYWHGVDFTLNARTRWGLTFSGGTSTGRSVTDECVTTVLIDSPDPRNCRDADPFQTTFRGLASYTIPKIDVLVSGTVRSQPQVERTASWDLPNSPTSSSCAPNPAACTTVLGLLGRLPSRFECERNDGDHAERQRQPDFQQRASDAGRHAIREDPPLRCHPDGHRRGCGQSAQHQLRDDLGEHLSVQHRQHGERRYVEQPDGDLLAAVRSSEPHAELLTTTAGGLRASGRAWTKIVRQESHAAHAGLGLGPALPHGTMPFTGS